MGKLNNWVLTAEALRAGMNSQVYSELEYMCSTVNRLVNTGILTPPHWEAYLKLWRKLSKGCDNGSLMGYLSDRGLLPPDIWWSSHRLAVGYAFWGAVADYIESTDKPSLIAVRKAGAKAVKALKLGVRHLNQGRMPCTCNQ